MTNQTNSLPDEWVLLSEAVLLIAYNTTLKSQIQTKFMELYNSGLHPDWIKHVGINKYRFNKKYLEDFCRVYGFDLAAPLDRNAQDYKTNDWFSAKDLRAYLPGSERQINNILKELQVQMPAAIQTKLNGPFMRLCLHKDYISTLKNIVKQRDIKRIHTLLNNISFVEKDGPDEWISATDLRQLILNGAENREFLHDMLVAILQTGLYPFVIHNTSNKRFLFNKKYLYEFCKQCQFGVKDTPNKKITWLRVVDLQKIISKPCKDFSQTLTAALRDLYESGKHPDWVCHPSERRYYLNKKYVVQFAKMYKFNLVCRDTRTDEWLSATEIVLQVKRVSAYNILQLLQKHQADMPSWIQVKLKHQLPCLCLHRDHIQDFCKTANIQMLEDKNIKTSDWFSVSEYRLFLKDFDASTQMESLEAAFKIISQTYPDWVQPKLCKSGEIKLCLHKKHVQDFCVQTGFVCDNKKTEDWLDVRELGLVLNMSPAKILVILKMNQKNNSDIIQIKYIGSAPALCLKSDSVAKITEWQKDIDIDSAGKMLIVLQNLRTKLK